MHNRRVGEGNDDGSHGAGFGNQPPAPEAPQPLALGRVTRRLGFGEVSAHLINIAAEVAVIAGAFGVYGGPSEVALGCQIAAGVLAPDALSSTASVAVRPALNFVRDGLGDGAARVIYAVAGFPGRTLNFVDRGFNRAASALIGVGGTGRRVYDAGAVEEVAAENAIAHPQQAMREAFGVARDRDDAVIPVAPEGVREEVVDAEVPGVTPRPNGAPVGLAAASRGEGHRII